MFGTVVHRYYLMDYFVGYTIPSGNTTKGNGADLAAGFVGMFVSLVVAVP